MADLTRRKLLMLGVGGALLAVPVLAGALAPSTDPAPVPATQPGATSAPHTVAETVPASAALSATLSATEPVAAPASASDVTATDDVVEPTDSVPNLGGAQELAVVQLPLGRAILNRLPVREKPAMKAKLVRLLKANEVVAVSGQVSGDGPAYNQIWYQLADGFVHSAFVQPCENAPNAPLSEVPEDGVWGEVSVPATEVRAKPDARSTLRELYFYSCVLRVTAVARGEDGAAWYRLRNGYPDRRAADVYILAEHVRPISRADLLPLSPDVPAEHKRIEVDLEKQELVAYEDDRPVHMARVATGGSKTPTPRGTFSVYLKRTTQRMIGGMRGSEDAYDQPAIGWVSYFERSGVAFHAAYWHNDFGHRRSHGCVNLLPADARWIYRWTTPAAEYADASTRSSRAQPGTQVKVF